MTAGATLSSWLEGLGLEVKEAGGSPGERLSIMPTPDGDPSVAVQRSDPATWEVVHERRVEESELSSDWHAPWDTEPPIAVVGRAVQEVAYGFPLVASETHAEGDAASIRLRAPVFDDGLTRQAFVLTVSSVLNAARVLDLVMARRAEDRAAWEEFEATSDQREREQQQLIDRLAEAPAAPESTDPVAGAPQAPSTADTAPAVAWSPTHEVKRRANAWAQPDPAAARAGALARRVPVQVVERQGEWARVVTSNGWAGWIDSRDLKAR